MTITINLEPEKEAQLRQKAARSGRPVEQIAYDFVLQGLDEPEVEDPVQPKQTRAEALVGHIGTQHSGRGDLSQNTGKVFTRLIVPETHDERKAHIYALMGSMAYLGPSHISEDRAEEITKDEPTLAELFAGRTGLINSKLGRGKNEAK